MTDTGTGKRPPGAPSGATFANLDPESQHWFHRLALRVPGADREKLEKLVEAVQADAYSRAESQAVWRSTPEIVKALDALDDYTSSLAQSYTHARAPMNDDLAQVLKLAASVSLRIRSQFRLTSSASGTDASQDFRSGVGG